jgi:TPR repeat protein
VIPAFAQDNYVDTRHAAEKGDPNAQLKLGLMYLNGEGVAQNNFEAAKWVRKSAEQGNAEAQFYLGLGYATGIKRSI